MLHTHIILMLQKVFHKTKYILQDNMELVLFQKFSLHQVYMTNSDMPPIKPQLYNVQPTSQT